MTTRYETAEVSENDPDAVTKSMTGQFGHPVVVRSYSAPHPKMNSKIFDLFKDDIVSVLESPGSGTTKQVAFRDFFENARNYRLDNPGVREYMIMWQPRNVMGICEKVRYPSFMRGNVLDYFTGKARRIMDMASNWIFIGGGGCYSNLHYDHDYVHTFLYQQNGNKEVILIDPIEWKSVEKNQIALENQCISSLDWFNDSSLIPCDYRRVTLRPGDLIFIPGCWYHTTRCLDFNITISRDYVNSMNFEMWVTSVVNGKQYAEVFGREQ